jgi:hypothetical protein
VLKSAANRLRASEGKSPLVFARPGTVLNNYKLIEKCSGYELLRFRHEPKFDHVYYIVDVKNLWDVDLVGLSPPQPQESPSDFLVRARDAARKVMTSRARGDQRSDDEWAMIAGGLHPCVLMWERESLILPVADALGLGEAEVHADDVRGADGWVERRFKLYLKQKYNKAIDGVRLLTRIADSAELTERVLRSNGSLREIVASMVALEEG